MNADWPPLLLHKVTMGLRLWLTACLCACHECLVECLCVCLSGWLYVCESFVSERVDVFWFVCLCVSLECMCVSECVCVCVFLRL